MIPAKQQLFTFACKARDMGAYMQMLRNMESQGLLINIIRQSRGGLKRENASKYI